MTTATKLASFGAGLAVLFGGGTLAGAALGPEPADPEPAASAHRSDADPEGHTAVTSDTGSETNTDAHGAGAAADPVRGLAVGDAGLRVVVDDPELRRGHQETLRFRIVDDAGQTVRDFDVEHTKRMHLIVARRDLTGFQHLHPEQRRDGTWTTRVTLDEAGSYRLFADFSHEDTARTLATDLRVDGRADLRPLPAAQPTAISDGRYEVRLDAGDARPGEDAELRFSITKDGAPVHVEPYLGADGHLVALREGDLAFLHVHPVGDDDHGDSSARGGEHDDAIAFAATFPTAGRYRLFLQFQHEGRVQTVAFTQEVNR